MTLAGGQIPPSCRRALRRRGGCCARTTELKADIVEMNAKLGEHLTKQESENVRLQAARSQAPHHLPFITKSLRENVRLYTSRSSGQLARPRPAAAPAASALARTGAGPPIGRRLSAGARRLQGADAASLEGPAAARHSARRHSMPQCRRPGDARWRPVIPPFPPSADARRVKEN